MKHQQLAVASRPIIAATITMTIMASAALIALMVFNSQATRAALPPAFNSHNKLYPIARSNTSGDVVDNVSRGNGYETDFFRVGLGGQWDMSGSFGDNSIEVCQDGQVLDLWVYAHNSVATRHNHNAGLNYGVNDLTFTGDGVARNSKLQISSPNLNNDVYSNSHTLTALLSADNATDASKTVEISCSGTEIALVTTGVDGASVKTWAAQDVKIDHNNNPTANGISQKVKHEKAKQVFGAGYGLVNADQIFDTGTLIGYNGNLPACRYYSAYVKVQVKVVLKPAPVEKTPMPTKGTSTEEDAGPTSQTVEETPKGDGPSQVNNLGSEDNANLALAVAVAGLVVVAGTAGRQLAVVRAHRRNQK